MNLPPFIHEHPAITIGLVAVGGVLLFALAGGASAPASTVVGTQQADPQIQAAQISAAASAAHDMVALQVQNGNNATTLAMAQNAGINDLIQTSLAARLEDMRINTQAATDRYTTDVNGALASKQIDAQVATQLAGLTAQQTVQLAGINAQTDIAHTSASLQLGLTQSTADVQKTIANIQADTTKNLASANLQQNLAELNNQHDLQAAQIQSQTAIALRQAKNSGGSTLGAIAGLAGTILSFL